MQDKALDTRPLVSVIVPVYNSEKTLAACIADLRSQSLPDLEVIFVDDGSRDKSGEMLLQAAAQNPRFRLLRQENQGSAAARAHGIRHAAGRYVGFMDADDRISPQMYLRMGEWAEKEQADVVVCGYQMETESGTVLESCRPPHEIIEGDLAPWRFYLRAVATVASQWNKLIRTEIAQQIGPIMPLKIGEDLAFCTDLAPRVHKAVILDEPFYRYVQHGQSIMNKEEDLHALPNQVDHFLSVLAADPRFDGNGARWKQVLLARALVSLIFTKYSNRQRSEFFLQQIQKMRTWEAFPPFCRSLWTGSCLSPLREAGAISSKTAAVMRLAGLWMWLGMDRPAAALMAAFRKALERRQKTAKQMESREET